MIGLDITKDDSSSTDNTWKGDEIHDFISHVKKTRKIYPPTIPNFKIKKYRPLKEVEVDDPRPPIKQRLGVESEPAKCLFCQSDRVYSDHREKWICPFCEL